MAGLSKHFKSKPPGLETPNDSAKRSRLYVLAAEPATPGALETAEWSLELVIPQSPQLTSVSPAVSRSSSPQPQSKDKSFFHHFRKPERPSRTSNAIAPATTVQAEPALPDTHHYLLRFHTDSASAQPPTNTTLKVFLCSISSDVPSTSTSLVAHLVQALSAIHTTSNSASWLGEALFAFQIAEIIPSVSCGLDVNKFMCFAISYLEQHMREIAIHADQHGSVKVVNYSNIVRENERLRRMFSSDATDYAVVDTTVKSTDRSAAIGDVDDDEEMWNSPARPEAPTSNTKTWGGFWITLGSGATSNPSSHERPKRDPWQRSDPYGGLM